MAKKVAELLVDTLAQAGVERIYGVLGDSMNGITDSIRKQKKIDGFTSGMKRRQRSPPGPKHTLRDSLQSVPEAPDLAICI
jgi:hypothetical protein